VIAPNITPDRTTGIGAWSADDFWRALHNGKSRDGRLLYPAFPYTNYTKVTRDDADALFAYLRSLPPVRQPNQPHELRFPYNQQLAGGLAPALLQAGRVQRRYASDADWNRGAYLVEGLGHCSACHSSAQRAGREPKRPVRRPDPGAGWYAPSLTSAPKRASAVGRRTSCSCCDRRVAARAVFGPMAEVVRKACST
jgi:mono/diheme cytochrome c family protein